MPLGPYSMCKTHNGIVYVSGIVPVKPGEKTSIDADFSTQCRLVFSHLKNCLEAHDSCLEYLLKLRVYVTDISNGPLLNELYPQLVPQPYPTRVLIEVSKLPFNAPIEIEAEAYQQ